MNIRSAANLAVAACTLGAAAQDTELVLRAQKGARSVVAVEFTSPPGLDPAWSKAGFGPVLLQDLRQSGVFQVKESTGPSPSSVPSSDPEPVLLLKIKLDNTAARTFSAAVDVSDPRARQLVYSKQYSGGEPSLRRMAHRIVDDLVARITGTRGVADSRILFAREVSPGVKELFQVDRDGHAPRQLTRIGSLTITPTVAEDGRMAFLTYKGGGPEIWGQARTDGPFSRLYPFKSSFGLTVSTPVWSPDGKRLALVEGDRRGNTNIKILDVGTRRVRQLTAHNGINTEPAWNPSGTQIAFTSDRDGSPQVYLMEEDGSNPRRLTQEGKYNAGPAWSPDGSMIAYVSRFDQGFHVFIHKLAEGRAYQLTQGPGSHESPAWSPDGRFLVYTNNAGGSARLFISDLAGTEPQPLSDLPHSQSPEWTRSR